MSTYNVENLHGEEEFQSVIDSLAAAKADKATVTAPTFTASSGTLPTPNGAVAIADANTPTVAELLEAVVELRATVAALCTAIGTATT